MEKNKEHKINRGKGEEQISRKQAIKKTGYAAFSAATMMLLLNDPAKAQGQPGSDSGDAPAPLDPFEGW